MRTTMAMEGVVVVAVDVVRTATGEYGLAPRVRVTTRGMWTGEGALLAELTKVSVDGGCGSPPFGQDQSGGKGAHCLKPGHTTSSAHNLRMPT